MSESGVFVEFEGPSPAEMTIPPVLFAVPATTRGPLPPHQLVTLATWGGWLIDEAFVVAGPHGVGREESYDIASFLGSHRARPSSQESEAKDPKLAVEGRRVPTSELWVYDPAPGSHDLFEIPAWNAGMWFENVREDADADTPPPRRRPRPARELPSLTGRRLYGPRVSSDGRPEANWVWWVGVSEPLSEEGGFFVRVLSLTSYARACVGGVGNWVGMPLHRLFAY